MKWEVIAVLVSVTVLAGCTAIRYQDGQTRFSRYSVGTDLTAKTLTVEQDSNGVRRVTMEGYQRTEKTPDTTKLMQEAVK